MNQRFRVGDKVKVSQEHLDNYGLSGGEVFEVEAVYTTEEEHPGYDPIGDALYSLKGLNYDLYDYELEGA